jgi:hypothetical protein
MNDFNINRSGDTTIEPPQRPRHPRGIPPEPYDLRVSLLPPTRAASVTRMVTDQEGDLELSIDAMIVGGEMWVARWSLQELCAPGHCTFDPDDDCCYIPDILLVDREALARELSEARLRSPEPATPLFPTKSSSGL